MFVYVSVSLSVKFNKCYVCCEQFSNIYFNEKLAMYLVSVSQEIQCCTTATLGHL